MLNNTSWDQQLSRLNTNNKRILKVRQMYWIQFRCMEISFYAAAVESYRCVRRIFSISLLTHRWAVECRKLLWVYGYESPKAELSSMHEQINLSHSIRRGAHKHAHSIVSCLQTREYMQSLASFMACFIWNKMPRVWTTAGLAHRAYTLYRFRIVFSQRLTGFRRISSPPKPKPNPV